MIAYTQEMTMMRPWQEYILSRITPETMRSAPDWARSEPIQPRFLDYDQFRSDTLVHFGAVAAVCLSMAYKPKVVVEMGTHSGSTSFILCRANPQARVYGIDMRPCIESRSYLPAGYTAFLHGVDNFAMHIGKSWEFAMPGNVDMSFIDAEHCGDAPYKDSVRAWENRNVNHNWCIAWDDYHPSCPDVVNAVDRFVREVGMDLRKLMSWVYIGTLPHSAVEEYIGVNNGDVL